MSCTYPACVLQEEMPLLVQCSAHLANYRILHPPDLIMHSCLMCIEHKHTYIATYMATILLSLLSRVYNGRGEWLTAYKVICQMIM